MSGCTVSDDTADRLWSELPDELAAMTGTARQRITDWFISAVESHRVVPSQRLPGERELSRICGVSRMTLRLALADLEGAGVIVRRRGAGGGAFVRDDALAAVDLTSLAGLRAMIAAAGLTPGSRVLRAVTVAAPDHVTGPLRLPPSAAVHHLVRVRTADGVPVGLERSYFPASRFPDLLDHDVTGSIYDVLAEYGCRPHTATEVLRAVLLGADEAKLLDTQRGAPVIQVVRTAYSSSGVAVEFSEDAFRSDMLELRVNSTIP